MSFSIAVIGGGVAGVASSSALVKELTSKGIAGEVELLVFEKSQTFGVGEAFGTSLSSHLLNQPASTMSLEPNKPNSFLEYTQSKYSVEQREGFSPSEDPFYPRAVFGKYIEDFYRLEVSNPARSSGLVIRTIKKEVIGINQENDGMSICSDNGDVHKVDFAILCIGNQPPTNYSVLKKEDGYVDHAWPETKITDVLKPSDHVGILGSGLTAVDSVLTITETNHVGQISMFSRSGLLPSVRPHQYAVDLKLLTKELIEQYASIPNRKLTWRKIATLFEFEALSAGVDVGHQMFLERRNARSALENLINDIDACSTDKTWFAVLKSVDNIIADIWLNLDSDSKRLFAAEYRRSWNSAAYPMPYANGFKILRLLNEKSLVYLEVL